MTNKQNKSEIIGIEDDIKERYKLSIEGINKQKEVKPKSEPKKKEKEKSCFNFKMSLITSNFSCNLLQLTVNLGLFVFNVVVVTYLTIVYNVEIKNYHANLVANRSEYSTVSVLVRHSYTSIPPECPKDTKKLWDGYSLLGVRINSELSIAYYYQDLGSVGSCARIFNVSPFIYNYIDSNTNKMIFDYENEPEMSVLSLWLSTTVPPKSKSIAVNDVEQYISRCSACEAQYNVMAIHSQTKDIPDCPNNWTSLWFGYSIAMYTEKFRNFVGWDQHLSSTGSCIEEFRDLQFFECKKKRFCDISNATNIWISALNNEDQVYFNKGPKFHVSRCSVCMVGSYEEQKVEISDIVRPQFNKIAVAS